MVYKIVKGKIGLFIEALVITMLILVVGFFLGFFLENYRLNKVIDSYKNFEVDALDLKLQNYYYQIMDSASCEEAIRQNLIFADKIYNRGLIIQVYEDAGKLKLPSLLTEKKKQVLLKTELWLNSLLLKDKCKNSFHTVVYFYSQNPGAIREAEQSAISKTLENVKKDLGNKIVLIPIAGDLGLDSIDLQMRIYNVTSLPSILIDEKIILGGFESEETIKGFLK
jgi:hypothetical protein